MHHKKPDPESWKDKTLYSSKDLQPERWFRLFSECSFYWLALATLIGVKFGVDQIPSKPESVVVSSLPHWDRPHITGLRFLVAAHKLKIRITRELRPSKVDQRSPR